MVKRASASKEEILDAAEQLMAAKGVDSTSITDICRESGLPVGSIYWHFGNKAGLLAAVLLRGEQRFFDRLPHPEHFPGTAAERFDHWFAANAGLIAERPQFLRLHLSLCLLDEREGRARAISLEVRATALERLTSAIRPWLAELGVQDAAGASAELGALMLATVDGIFIAQQIDPSTSAPLLESLRLALHARAEALTS